MTHPKRHRLPQGERAITAQLAGQFPLAAPFMALPNNCQADFVTQTSIFEIEPVARWQHGLAQVLEYWTLALQSLHPVLLLLTNQTVQSRRAFKRAETTCDPLPLQLFAYNVDLGKWERGGPNFHYADVPFGPPLTPRGEIWTAPGYLLKVYETLRLPYVTWKAIYDRRHRYAA